MRVAVFYNRVAADASAADRDVLVQAEAVSDALRELGHEPVGVPCDLNLAEVQRQLLELHPDVVFNLVESLAGSDHLVSMIPLFLEALGLAYTGSSSEGLFLTNHKLLAKERMVANGIPTPAWAVLEAVGGVGRGSPCESPRRRLIFHAGRRPAENSPAAVTDVASRTNQTMIVKTVTEHASLGLDEHSLVSDVRLLPERIGQLEQEAGRACFAEEYIDGREFNLSVLAGRDGPAVLPPAEIDFGDYPPEKVRVVGQRAKWDESSFEYHHTPRRFAFPQSDQALLRQLEGLGLECWRAFGLGGHVRVDFRVDVAGQPYVLEINTNPCISPDAGFAAAVAQAGLSYAEAVRRILENGLQRTRS